MLAIVKGMLLGIMHKFINALETHSLTKFLEHFSVL